MAKAESTIAAAEHKIEGFAEDLGKMLGHARAKAAGWMGQRQNIVKSLTELRDEATKLLRQLGHEVSEVPFPRSLGGRGRAVTKRGPGRPAGSKNSKGIIIVGGKKRRKMSAQARAAISAAQKARWAKQKAGAKK